MAAVDLGWVGSNILILISRLHLTTLRPNEPNLLDAPVLFKATQSKQSDYTKTKIVKTVLSNLSLFTL